MRRSCRYRRHRRDTLAAHRAVRSGERKSARRVIEPGAGQVAVEWHWLQSVGSPGQVVRVPGGAIHVVVHCTVHRPVHEREPALGRGRGSSRSRPRGGTGELEPGQLVGRAIAERSRKLRGCGNAAVRTPARPGAHRGSRRSAGSAAEIELGMASPAAGLPVRAGEGEAEPGMVEGPADAGRPPGVGGVTGRARLRQIAMRVTAGLLGGERAAREDQGRGEGQQPKHPAARGHEALRFAV
jgi:hypothetical protein